MTEERKPRVYISGPISGHDKEAVLGKFACVETMLEGQGFRVFNPTKNGLSWDATTHQHMHRDLAVLTNEEDPFDCIFMMERWLHSAGCKLEFDVATACGMSVIFEELYDSSQPLKFK